jgi:hypothetical protein
MQACGSLNWDASERSTMPLHDWTRVDAGIFHHFHHCWITAITAALNEGLLPPEYYALAEQQAAGFGPDVLTLQTAGAQGSGSSPDLAASRAGTLLTAPPRARFQAEWEHEFHRRKKSTIVVRHVSGDAIVAVVEIVSPGNKAGRHPFRALVEKALDLLEYKVQLLILDLFPPGKRDPRGIHSAIWEEITDEVFAPPPDKPLTLVAYESDLTVKAFIEPVAVGDVLPDMPLFLEFGAHVLVPLEATYDEAFASVPARWREILLAY